VVVLAGMVLLVLLAPVLWLQLVEEGQGLLTYSKRCQFLLAIRLRLRWVPEALMEPATERMEILDFHQWWTITRLPFLYLRLVAPVDMVLDLQQHLHLLWIYTL
jgi:hypothetical protein